MIRIYIYIIINIIEKIYRRIKRKKKGITIYECGIEIKTNRIKKIYIKYYIVSIIFIIFDIEITILIIITQIEEINKIKINIIIIMIIISYYIEYKTKIIII
jgi:NADH:ubiquinone oxidoreductase subunit 3 (subunit A)